MALMSQTKVPYSSLSYFTIPSRRYIRKEEKKLDKHYP